MTKRLLRLSSAVGAIVLSLSGCGGQDTAESATGASTAQAAADRSGATVQTQAVADAVATVLRSPLFGDAGGVEFNDPVDVQTELRSIQVNHGYWIDGIKARSWSGDLPGHGGFGGTPNAINLPRGEYLVAIHGRQGSNTTSPAISQISFVTNRGHVYGPYGQGLGQGQTTPFHFRVPYGGRIVGFSGRAGTFLNAIGVQYVVEPPASGEVVATPIVGAPGGAAFTDTVVPGQNIIGLQIQNGSWVDGIRPLATPADLPLRGASSGLQDYFDMGKDDVELAGNSIVRVFGWLGGDPVAPAISQISFETAYFKEPHGPYGQLLGQDPRTPFDIAVPAGHRVVGFTGRAGTYLNAIGLLSQAEGPPPIRTYPMVGWTTGTAFADPVSAGQWLTGFTVHHGFGIDGIQGFEGGFALPAHGGRGGSATTVTLDPGEYLVGVAVGWDSFENAPRSPAIRTLQFRSNRGRYLGTFGMQVGSYFFTKWDVPFGGRIVGFTGRDGDGPYLNAFGVQYVMDMRAPVTEASWVYRADTGEDLDAPRRLPPGEWLGGINAEGSVGELAYASGMLCRGKGSTCGTYPPGFGSSLYIGEMVVGMSGVLGGSGSVEEVSFTTDWGRRIGPFGGLNSPTWSTFDYNAPVDSHILDLRTSTKVVDGTNRIVAIGAIVEKNFLAATTSPVFGSPLGFEFHDLAAPGQVLTGVRIHHGYWVDSIQALATPFDRARHGGDGGSASTFTLQAGEHIVRIFGLAGANLTVPAIAQISFQTSAGRTFGPYGQGLGQDPTTPFDYTVPPGGRVVGFTGRADQFLNAIGVQFVIGQP